MGYSNPVIMRAPTATFAAVICVAMTARGRLDSMYSLNAGNMTRDQPVPPPQRTRPVSV